MAFVEVSSDRILSDEDIESAHDDLIDEVFDEVRIGIYSWAPSRVLKMMDPVAYRVSVIEYIDQLVDDGQIVEV